MAHSPTMLQATLVTSSPITDAIKPFHHCRRMENTRKQEEALARAQRIVETFEGVKVGMPRVCVLSYSVTTAVIRTVRLFPCSTRAIGVRVRHTSEQGCVGVRFL